MEGSQSIPVDSGDIGTDNQETEGRRKVAFLDPKEQRGLFFNVPLFNGATEFNKEVHHLLN